MPSSARSSAIPFASSTLVVPQLELLAAILEGRRRHVQLPGADIQLPARCKARRRAVEIGHVHRELERHPVERAAPIELGVAQERSRPKIAADQLKSRLPAVRAGRELDAAGDAARDARAERAAEIVEICHLQRHLSAAFVHVREHDVDPARGVNALPIRRTHQHPQGTACAALERCIERQRRAIEYAVQFERTTRRARDALRRDLPGDLSHRRAAHRKSARQGCLHGERRGHSERAAPRPAAFRPAPSTAARDSRARIASGSRASRSNRRPPPRGARAAPAPEPRTSATDSEARDRLHVRLASSFGVRR